MSDYWVKLLISHLHDLIWYEQMVVGSNDCRSVFSVCVYEYTTIGIVLVWNRASAHVSALCPRHARAPKDLRFSRICLCINASSRIIITLYTRHSGPVNKLKLFWNIQLDHPCTSTEIKYSYVTEYIAYIRDYAIVYNMPDASLPKSTFLIDVCEIDRHWNWKLTAMMALHTKLHCCNCCALANDVALAHCSA